MNAIDFVNKVVGKPWINRAEGNGAYDCWGLVLASFREVDGLELPSVAGYKDESCPTVEAAKGVDFSLFPPTRRPKDGAIMAVFDNKGNIQHVGRCLCGVVIHSTESLGVRSTSYNAIMSEYKNVRYFTYAPNNT